LPSSQTVKTNEETMSVIIPPAEVSSLTALLQILANPKETATRLSALQQAQAELMKAQNALSEKMRQFENVKTKQAEFDARVAAVQQREDKVTAAELDLRQREAAIQKLRAKLVEAA
jgi:hypothetical protein